MKDKRKQLFLLAGVILIWGAIGYQLYSLVDPPEPVIVRKEKNLLLPDTAAQQTYELIARYRDPFLKSERKSSGKVTRQPQVVRPKVSTTDTKPANWEALRFLGTVENENTQERVALVSFQGKMMMLKKNDVIHEFSIVRVFKDSIQVSHGKQKRTILKSSK